MSAADSVTAHRAAAAAPLVAEARHRPLAIRVLARAFATDPVMNWVVRADARRGVALEQLFEGILGDEVLGLGQVHLAADGSACALCLPPAVAGQPRSSLERLLLLRHLWPVTGFSRLGRVLRLMYTMDTRHPHTPEHYYVWFLGVDPELQGHGLGSLILNAVLSGYDRAGVPSYLENSNPRNTPFYTRHGFKSRGEFRATPDAPPLLAMWREPRAR